jgi:hypothetical protein
MASEMKAVVIAARIFFVLVAAYWAYNIRLHAINIYGRVSCFGKIFATTLR